MAANLNVDRLDFSSPKPFHVTENVDSFRKLLQMDKFDKKVLQAQFDKQNEFGL